MSSRTFPRQHDADPVAGRAIERAQADYQRLRQAYLELAQGQDNEVALAMVGADMERANRSLQSLSGHRPPVTQDPGRIVQREARPLVEENA